MTSYPCERSETQYVVGSAVLHKPFSPEMPGKNGKQHSTDMAQSDITYVAQYNNRGFLNSAGTMERSGKGSKESQV